MFQSLWGLKRCILLQGLKAGEAGDGKAIDQILLLLFLLLRLLLGFPVVGAPLFLLLLFLPAAARTSRPLPSSRSRGPRPGTGPPPPQAPRPLSRGSRRPGSSGRRRRRRGRRAARGGQQGPGRVAAWTSAAPLLPVSVSARAASPPSLPFSCPARTRGRGRLHGDGPQRRIRRRRGPKRPVRRPRVLQARRRRWQGREGPGFLFKTGSAGPELAPRPRPREPAPPPGRQARRAPPPYGRRGRDEENGAAVPLRRGLRLSTPGPFKTTQLCPAGLVRRWPPARGRGKSPRGRGRATPLKGAESSTQNADLPFKTVSSPPAERGHPFKESRVLQTADRPLKSS